MCCVCSVSWWIRQTRTGNGRSSRRKYTTNAPVESMAASAAAACARTRPSSAHSRSRSKGGGPGAAEANVCDTAAAVVRRAASGGCGGLDESGSRSAQWLAKALGWRAARHATSARHCARTRPDSGSDAAAAAAEEEAPRAVLSLRLRLRLWWLKGEAKRGAERDDRSPPPPAAALAASACPAPSPSPANTHTGRHCFLGPCPAGPCSDSSTAAHARGCSRRFASRARMPATRASTSRSRPCRW